MTKKLNDKIKGINIGLDKRNVPEIALSKMFKKEISEIRDRIMHLMNKR